MKASTCYPPLRAYLNNYSTRQIRGILNAAGFPTYDFDSGSFKEPVLRDLDFHFSSLNAETRNTRTLALAKEILSDRPEKEEELNDILSNVGWSLQDGELCPNSFSLPEEFSEQFLHDYKKALRRYRLGDFQGTMTSLLGIVEKSARAQWERINELDINEFAGKPLHEKVSSCQKRALTREYCELAKNIIGNEFNEKHFTDNLGKAISNLAYVLGMLREVTDVHGEEYEPNKEVVKLACDISLFLARVLSHAP